MSEDGAITSLVMDLGSSTCKVGYSGEDKPKAVVSSVVGKPLKDLDAHPDLKSSYVGSDAYSKRELLALSWPIRRGVVENWDDLEVLLQHIYSTTLAVRPEEHAVLVADALLNPRSNREQLVECLFEKFGCPGVFVKSQNALALYSSGRTTGVVLTAGHGLSSAIAIQEGYALSHCMFRNDFGGDDLIWYLKRLLAERGYRFSASTEYDLLRSIKEKLCHVEMPQLEEQGDQPQPVVSPQEESGFTLPDGTEIKLDKERTLCPEALFRPSLLGIEDDGFQDTVFNAISKSDPDMRKELYRNIVLSGGTTLFPGLAERLQYEIRSLCPGKSPVKVISPKERRYSAWIGGSVLTSMTTTRDMWFTKQEYEEKGAHAVHQKCIY